VSLACPVRLQWRRGGGTDAGVVGAGFDYTRITRDTMKCLYQVVVPRAVLEQFPNGDGHISASTMRMTPNSVGEGLIQIVEDKVVDEPNENKMGTMMILPEGLGDRESLENCVKFTPRDSNVDVQMESTVDMNKTGQRQKLIKKGVAGMTLCLCAFARNQQPDQAEMVRRTEDLGRVCTLICSSGGEELSRTDVVSPPPQPLVLACCDARVCGVCSLWRTATTRSWGGTLRRVGTGGLLR